MKVVSLFGMMQTLSVVSTVFFCFFFLHNMVFCQNNSLLRARLANGKRACIMRVQIIFVAEIRKLGIHVSVISFQWSEDIYSVITL